MSRGAGLSFPPLWGGGCNPSGGGILLLLPSLPNNQTRGSDPYQGRKSNWKGILWPIFLLPAGPDACGQSESPPPPSGRPPLVWCFCPAYGPSARDLGESGPPELWPSSSLLSSPPLCPVTVRCTPEGSFSVAIARDAVLPPLRLDSLRLLSSQGQHCGPVARNKIFAVFNFPLSACGTTFKVSGEGFYRTTTL